MEKYIIKQNTVYIHGIKIDDHIVHSVLVSHIPLFIIIHLFFVIIFI